MPKRLDNIFYEKLKFKNMLEAYERSCKKKRKHTEVIKYQLDAASNIITVLKQLYSGEYQVSQYREFTIYEPKQRVIQSLPFKDRIVQQWYVEEFIKPIYMPMFIEQTYACIEKRGVHKAVKTLSRYIYNLNKRNPNMYILKCDISKFFYSINKKILYELMCRKVKDKQFLRLTKMFIYHNDSPEGIPIGNYTSQYFANIYLNVLDHYVKEKLRIKYYVRYMDDFVLLLNNKEEAKETLQKLKEFLEQNLELTLNKKTNYFKGKQGVIFCGYKIMPGYILLRKEKRKKICQKVKNWNKLYDENKLDLKNTAMKLNSWVGHAQNADCYNLIHKIKDDCKWLYTGEYQENWDETEEK